MIIFLNAADAITFNGHDVDVSLVTPGNVPRVSHDVVFLACGVFGVPNDCHGMVDVGCACGGVDDTGLVAKEYSIVCSHKSRNWTLSNGSKQVSSSSCRNLVVVSDSYSTSGISLALPLFSLVWVILSGHLRMFLQVIEGVVVPTSIATCRCSVAINQLLL